MKTLILYASAGSGHKKAAEAVYAQLKNKNPKSEITLLDIVDFATPVFKFIYSKLYEFLITRARFVWGILFFLTNQPVFYLLNKKLRFFIDRSNLKKLSKHIIESQPELIISTHFLSSELIIYLKEKKKINSKVISIVTDFGVHYIWARKGADKYIVATKETKQELARFGIGQERIEIIGIPVREQFFIEKDKQTLREQFNIQEGFTVLLMTGAIGAGPIEKIVDNLYRDANIIVICGNNKKLFDKLVSRDYSSVKVLGFVDNVDEWMSVSDVLITKAGGITISEAITKLLPMIFFFLVPGQEKNNAGVMQDYGAAKTIKNIKHIKDFVLELKDNPDTLSRMQDNIRKIRNSEIASFTEHL